MVNRRDLARSLAKRTGLKQKDCEAVLRELRPVIAQALLDDEKVSIAGLGIFSTRVRKAWTGTNPLTGDPMVVEAQKVPVFRPCKAFHELEL